MPCVISTPPPSRALVPRPFDVVVALRPPQPDHGRAVDDRAEFARAHHLAQLQRAGRKRCCSITPSVTPASRAVSTSSTARSVEISSGFSSRMCLPAAAHLRTRSRCVFGGVRISTQSIALVGEDRVEAAGERKRKFLAERLAPRRARAERGGDLDAVLQVDQAPGMRRHRHAEADDRDPMLGHFVHCSARIAPRSSARPLRRPMPV